MKLENDKATKNAQENMFKFAVGLFFIVGVVAFVSVSNGEITNGTILAIAAAFGGYMAMNIGANDVANNVGPAVGSKAMSLGLAIVVAVIFEALGALVAGADVVGTIKGDIIDQSLLKDTNTFIWLMLAAILAGAIWLNIATALGAPVSTTHSIVGGVLGAGIAAGGFGVANWLMVGKIVLSWVISPVLGGLIAAGLLYLMKRTITYKDDMKIAASKVVPLLIAVMSFAFGVYILQKGLKNVIKIESTLSFIIGGLIAVFAYVFSKPLILRSLKKMKNSKEDITSLFTLPLIFAAALLSFAHGANDVANAVGPLAAINDAVMSSHASLKASIPLWIMFLGAFGIAIGLALYGPKLIKTVGGEITDLDKMRAFCIALSAALTVIVATSLGLPVSSTHIAVGGVFGVGFLREYLKKNYAQMEQQIIDAHHDHEQEQLDLFLKKFKKASFKRKTLMMDLIKNKQEREKEGLNFTKQERKKIKKVYKKELVKRSAFGKIIAAWLITVPLSALMAGLIFYTIKGLAS